MKDEYRKEMSKKHAPEELILKTKETMKIEAQKKSRLKNNYVYYGMIFAAAAIVLLIVRPFNLSISPNNTADIRMKKEQSIEPLKIEKGQNSNLQISETAEMPQEFLKAEESMINGVSVRIIADEKTGFIKGYYQKDEVSYVVLSKTVNVEEFSNDLGKLLIVE